MIDILNQRTNISPEKQFIKYDNQSISYHQFNNIVNNQHLPIIQHELMNDYCYTERYEQFTYCPTNKEVVQYEIDMFISPE